MNPLHMALTREARTLSTVIRPVSTDTPDGAMIPVSEVNDLLAALSPHSFKHVEAHNVHLIVGRAVRLTTDGQVTFLGRDVQTITQNLSRLNTAIARADKISRGIIPGALSASEARQIMMRRLGGRP